MIGGAAAASSLEEIIAMGAKKSLFFGSAGALDRKVVAGKLTVQQRAYRDEGVSYHYLPSAEFVKIPTATHLSEIFDELGISYSLSATWTTDAPYRETRANVERRRSAGCSVVEMECASLMAVAEFRNIPVYQFLYAADCLDFAQWDKRMLGNMPADMRGCILKVALETAKRIC